MINKNTFLISVSCNIDGSKFCCQVLLSSNVRPGLSFSVGSKSRADWVLRLRLYSVDGHRDQFDWAAFSRVFRDRGNNL